MNSAIGLAGVLLFALGGSFIIQLFYNPHYDYSNGGIGVIGFISSLLIALGLWVIVLSGKTETEKNSSQNARAYL